MLTKSFQAGTLYFHPAQQKAADLVFPACLKSVRLIRQLWELPVPPDLRVYVMTSWLQFFYQAAPWIHRILQTASFPLWAPKASRLWQYAGGWAQNFGARSTVGIKPPELIEQSDLSLGKRIFTFNHINAKIENLTCHELTHAFSLHLPLPGWLKEGLPTYTVDRYFDRPTIRPETLDLVLRLTDGGDLLNSKPFRVKDPDRTIARYVQGYWLTRWLEETRPGLIRSQLNSSHTANEFHRNIVEGCGKNSSVNVLDFWNEIRPEIASHFSQQIQS